MKNDRMKKAKMYLLNALLILIACNNATETETTQTDTSAQNDASTITKDPGMTDTTIGGCYSQIFNRDTVTLQIEVKSNNVTGPLTYKIYEKDMNDGSIKATLEDSVISGWYLFRSEGVMSVRQVAWRVKPGQLWPAMGEVMQRNDSTVFAKPGQLMFDSKKAFVKVNCVL